MPSRKSTGQPKPSPAPTAEPDDDERGGVCADCGGPLQLVRPGKWQCPDAPHGAPTEILDVPPDLAALFERHLGPARQQVPRQPDEFTALDLCRARGISDGRANAVLKQLMAEGRVTRRPGPGNSYYYRFAERP